MSYGYQQQGPPPGGGYGGGGGGGYGGPGGGGYGGGGGGYGGGYGGQGGGGGGGGYRGAPQGGGFAQPPRQQGPPPNADHQLWNWFTAVDVDNSGAITADELQKALINGDWTPFDLDTVKLLMSIFDVDRSGTIGFHEFEGLWKYIKDWQNVFRHFDRDRSGSIEGNELEQALTQFGYRLSPQLLDLVVKKYASGAGSQPQPQQPGYGGGGGGGISFDRFVRACVAIKQISETFGKLDSDRDGWIQINYEQFMQAVLSLP